MNKQQIVNYIAVRLNSLLTQPAPDNFLIRELSDILTHITRDDDFSYTNPGQASLGGSTYTYPQNIPVTNYGSLTGMGSLTTSQTQ
jgi:hypothetical protein